MDCPDAAVTTGLSTVKVRAARLSDAYLELWKPKAFTDMLP